MNFFVKNIRPELPHPKAFIQQMSDPFIRLRLAEGDVRYRRIPWMIYRNFYEIMEKTRRKLKIAGDRKIFRKKKIKKIVVAPKIEKERIKISLVDKPRSQDILPFSIPIFKKVTSTVPINKVLTSAEMLRMAVAHIEIWDDRPD